MSPAQEQEKPRKRRRRWGDAAKDPNPPKVPSNAVPSINASLDSTAQAKAKALALQSTIRARLAALKASKGSAIGGSKPTATPVSSSTVTAAATTTTPTTKTVVKEESSKRPIENIQPALAPSSKRAKHFALDFDAVTPTFETTKAPPPKPKVNPYLSIKQEEEGDESATTTTAPLDESEVVDERVMRASKPRKRNKALSFIEPGTFIEIAERKRQRAANAEISGFVSGRKAGNFVQSSNMAQVYGSGGGGTDVIAVDDDGSGELPLRAEVRYGKLPQVMEWWDMDLLPSKLKKMIASYEGKALAKESMAQMQQLGSSEEQQQDQQPSADSDVALNKDKSTSQGANSTTATNDPTEVLELRTASYGQASLSYCKTASLVQHIVPIEAPNAADGPARQPVLHLTKRELKRQRKLRRQERQRELQDRQAAGLEPPPEPRLTLKNFIRVLGDQAYLDPSQMEQKVMEQIQARQRAHLERNEANKLTKEQRSAKRAKKLQEDTSQGVTIALFAVKDMSHPYHRAKVDLNAQQSNITGGVLECQNPPISCVICEGGPKAIKRYKRLMLVRMKWTGPGDDIMPMLVNTEDPDAPQAPQFNPDNSAALVWQGLAVKRAFNGFVFQACETSDQARKILKAKGVGHYWDQVIDHMKGGGNTWQLKLGEETDDDSDQDEDGGVDNEIDGQQRMDES